MDALNLCLTASKNPTSTLASIPDNVTNIFLTMLTKKPSWVGGYQDSSGQWVWTDESDWTGYENWKSGEPNNALRFEDYLGINFKGIGLWNDYEPLVKLGSICQYDPYPCLKGWTYFSNTGKCYKHFHFPYSWKEALKLCKDKNSIGFSTLASVPDNTTNNFLITLTNKESWVGGYQDSSGQWIWSDGSNWTGYENWETGEPNNKNFPKWDGFEDYLGINHHGPGLWNDYAPLYKLGAICQYDQNPCFDGWVFLRHTGTCYKYNSKPATWKDARKQCQDEAHQAAGKNIMSDLASIPDNATNIFLTMLTRNVSWVGGYQDRSGHWKWLWSDGSYWTGYSNWKIGEPNNGSGGYEKHIGINFKGTGLWNDFAPSVKLGSICQYQFNMC